MALLAGVCLGATSGQAQDATWRATPGTGDFNTAANWNPASVPTGTAFFGTSNINALSFSASTTIGGWTFNAGASAYTFTNGQNLNFNGAGIVINGGSATITNNSTLQFFATSTAGSATITNNNVLLFGSTSTAGNATITNNTFLVFSQTSTAGSATITNNSLLRFFVTSTAGSASITNHNVTRFFGTSTAGSATINNNQLVTFFQNSTAGNATIINNNNVDFRDSSSAGTATITNNSILSFAISAAAGNATITNNDFLIFLDSSTAGNATITTNSGASTRIAGTASGGQARFITNAGGAVDLSFLSFASGGTSAGSIEGAGDYFLGSKQFTVGSNNLSTEVSGVIQDGGIIGGTGGSLVKVGNETLTLSGTNTYTGTTDVNAGTLLVNGSIVSSLTTVASGATLGGNGSVGPVSILSGGIYAPGNGIGTQTVNGNVTFAAGSFYQAQVNAVGQADLIDATGAATINGGTVQALAENGNYALNTTYTILTADGGRSGMFDNVTSNLVFLDPTLTYDAFNVFLTLTRNDTLLTDEANTPNQKAVAGALDQFPTDDPLFLAVVNQTASGARKAFDALSGEVHASVSGVLVDESRYVREAIMGRLMQASYGNGANPGAMAAVASGAPTAVASLNPPPMALGYGGKAIHAPPSYGLTFWSRAYGAWADFESDGNAASATRDLGGYLSGVDVGFGGTWRAGFATGYSRSDVDVNARSSSADVDSYHLAGYAGGMVGPVALRGGGAWAWQNVDTNRAVIFPGFFERETASYDGNTGQLFGEVAYPITKGKTAVEPFAGFAHVRVDTDGFTEKGGIAALRSAGVDETVNYSTLGLRLASVWHANGMAVVPHVSAAWQHAFNDVTPGAALAFASTGIGFGVAGVPLAEDSALIEAGLDLALSAKATVGASYSGQLANDVQDHAVKGRLNWRF